MKSLTLITITSHSRLSWFLLIGALLLNAFTLWLHVSAESAMGLFGLLLVPFIVQRQGIPVNWSWYTPLALVALLLYWVIPSPMVILLGVWWSIYALVEYRWGKLNALAFFLPFFFSRIVRHFLSIMAFPLRLKLTDWAVSTINIFDSGAVAHGSEIQMGAERFFVDTACVGLNLVSASFVLMFLVMAFRERLAKQFYQLWQTGLFLTVNALLLVGSNYARIVLLIAFQSEANTWHHEAIGLGSFVVFNLIPIYYFSRWMKPKKKRLPTFEPLMGKRHWVLLSAPIVLLASVQFSLVSCHKQNHLAFQHWERTQAGVFEKRHGTSTWYLKTQNPYSITNHHPLICWRGSGYQLKAEKVMEVGERNVYIAQLEKEGRIYQTAWWYESAEQHTIEELTWRLKSITKNTNYYLVNITSPTTSRLLWEISQFPGLPEGA